MNEVMNKQKLSHQLLLERIYDKNQLMPRIRAAFQKTKSKDFRKVMDLAGIDHKFGFDLLAYMALHKRATVPTIVGCLRHYFETAQQVADHITKAVQAGLVDYYDREQQLIVVYEISSSLQAELDRFQFPLPMVIPPRKLRSNLDSGYVTRKESVILRDNHTNDDVCLDHLNRVNATKLRINLEVAKTIQNKWKGLDKKKEDETREEYEQRKKAFQKYDSVAKEVMEVLCRSGNEIYLTHKYDKRGRYYCVGYHVNYQGNDWNKAVIEFADKEMLDD